MPFLLLSTVSSDLLRTPTVYHIKLSGDNRCRQEGDHQPDAHNGILICYRPIMGWLKGEEATNTHFTDEEIETHCLGYLSRSTTYK